MKAMKTPVIDRQKKTITVAKDFLIRAALFLRKWRDYSRGDYALQSNIAIITIQYV